MKLTLGKVVGVALMVIAVGGAFVMPKVIHMVTGKLPFVVLLGIAVMFGLGCYLALGNEFFPKKEDSEQPPWRDEDPSK